MRILTVSVYVLRWAPPGGAQVLLLERAQAPALGAWFQVTGRIEAGEAPSAAAWRETIEETGLTPERLYAANWVEQWYVPESDTMLAAPVFVATVAADSTIALNAENRSGDWLSIHAAIDRVSYPVQRDSLERLQRDFVAREPDERLLVRTTENHNLYRRT